jgi:hypothetical protein
VGCTALSFSRPQCSQKEETAHNGRDHERQRNEEETCRNISIGQPPGDRRERSGQCSGDSEIERSQRDDLRVSPQEPGGKGAGHGPRGAEENDQERRSTGGSKNRELQEEAHDEREAKTKMAPATPFPAEMAGRVCASEQEQERDRHQRPETTPRSRLRARQELGNDQERKHTADEEDE